MLEQSCGVPRFGGLPLESPRIITESPSNDNISDNDEAQPQSSQNVPVTENTALHALMQCYSDSEDEVPPKVPRNGDQLVPSSKAESAPTTRQLNAGTRIGRSPEQEAIEADVKRTLNSLVDRVYAKISNDQRKQNLRQKLPQNRSVNQRKLSLLEKLLAKDIRHERNILLQCVDYVIQMNFFDGESFDV